MAFLRKVVLFYLAVVCHGERYEHRIVGGSPADITEAPWQVVLLLDWTENGIFQFSSAGIIIRADVVATTGTVSDNTKPSQWKVRVGSTFADNGGQVIDVETMVQHENYTRQTVDYDISLFFLIQPIVLDGISTAAVPLANSDRVFVEGEIARFTGYGASNVGGHPLNYLKKLDIAIVDQEKCKNAFVEYRDITERMICAGDPNVIGDDACHLDFGGPLTIDNILVGIASWGRDCGTSGYPGVWTSIPSLRKWIDIHMM